MVFCNNRVKIPNPGNVRSKSTDKTAKDVFLRNYSEKPLKAFFKALKQTRGLFLKLFQKDAE